MTDVRDSAISFEGRKIRMNQTKEGWVLHLALHPNDAPPELMSALVGSRFAVVMVEINDDETPKVDPAKVEANRITKSAVMLAQNVKFQEWANVLRYDDPEDAATRYIKECCGIESRTELATNAEARKAFNEMRDLFQEEMLR